MKQLKSVDVYNQVRDKILNGELAEGTRLITRQLGAEYGLSDIPIREALWMLTRDGLITMNPYSGARVAGLDRDEVLEVLFIRGELEGIATALATPQVDAESLRRLHVLLSDMERIAFSDEPDPMAYSALNKAFHNEIFSQCPNRRLVDLINSLWEGHSNFQAVFRLNPERLKHSLAEHQAIVDAIGRGDAATAGELAKAHKELQKQDLLAVIQDSGEEKSSVHHD